jgi:ketosteroid isomerase-like protein
MKMLVKNESLLTETDAKDVVISFVKALNDDDFKTARNHLSDDMVFVGVLGSRDGAESYIQDMERIRLIDLTSANSSTSSEHELARNKFVLIRVIRDKKT